MDLERIALLDDLDAKIAAAVAANDALIEFERTHPGCVPPVAFRAVPDASQLARWRDHVAQIKAGTRTAG